MPRSARATAAMRCRRSSRIIYPSIRDPICLFAFEVCGRHSGRRERPAVQLPGRLPALSARRIPHRGPLARLSARPRERQPRRLAQRLGQQPDELQRPTWWLFAQRYGLSRATPTASRALRRSTAAGLSASDLAWAARSSWAFFASAAALRRSAKLAFLDQFISVFYAQENGSWPKGSTVSDRRSPRHIPGHGRDQD